eukprot:1161314-Pelagomonas_calceolata.AAC.3
MVLVEQVQAHKGVIVFCAKIVSTANPSLVLWGLHEGACTFAFHCMAFTMSTPFLQKCCKASKD